jgi:hypothetical protein
MLGRHVTLHKLSVEISYGKRQCGRKGYRWMDNIEIELQETYSDH